MFIDVYYFNDQLDGGPSTPFPDEKGASLHRPSQLWARWNGEILCQQGSCASWAAGWDNSTGYQWWHTIPTTHIEAKQKQVIRGRCSEKAQNSWQVDQIQQAFLMVGNMIPLRFGGELPSYRYVYIYTLKYSNMAMKNLQILYLIFYLLIGVISQVISMNIFKIIRVKPV